MILSPTKELLQYHFPKSITPPAGVSSFTIDFYVEGDSKHYTFNVNDEYQYSDFYVFNIDLSEYDDMPMDSEFAYTISGGNKVLERGMFRLGGYKAPKKEYNEEIEYKEYEF